LEKSHNKVDHVGLICDSVDKCSAQYFDGNCKCVR